ARDIAPFDSVPGSGFNASASAAAIVPPPGRIAGTGPGLALDPAQNNAFRALNRAWTHNGAVGFLPAGSGAGGRYVVSALSDSFQSELVRELALRAERVATDRVLPLRKPRLGLYQPWTGSMDEGWTRWVLEQYGFEFVLLHPEDFRTPLST